uniref:DNA-directed RNA polymerase subunit beta n=1 Tax=Auxenochlorella protothecoides TaxID=3075 RepID=A0A023HHU8_AUXPR|nr:beta subunit of RNA polymerase [Auxenochlorella protothecoides]AGL10870.1 beta subunit of RNA polymerase [Auxenochlorella protothecoides]AGN72512.1 beta subunit of RNA polymerase [Auxenochlorella protothecoides]ARU77434.1 DNA-directed RNA polymerase beta subunit [Auxenochlorella protothecoides]
MNLKTNLKMFNQNDIFLNQELPLRISDTSVNDVLKNHSIIIDETVNLLLDFYIKTKQKKQKINVLSTLPNLINIQQLSFKQFLEIGLISAIESQNPLKIKNTLYSFEVFYLSKYLQFKKPEKNITETINLNKTYGCPIYLPILLKSNSQSKAIFEWIYLGFLPFMTKPGHFLINGIPRVALNQLVRTPGIYKLIENKRTTKGIKAIPYIRIVPDKGSWLNISFDSKNRLWITTKIFRKKISMLVFLQALGIDIHTIFNTIGHSEILLSSIVPPVKSLNSERLTRHDAILIDAGLISHPVTQVEACKYLYSHFMEYRSPANKQRQPITEKKALLFFQQVVWNSENKYLGISGRDQFLKKLGTTGSAFNQIQLTKQDFILITQTIINILYGEETIDDIDNLNNKKIRGCGDFLYQELARGLNEFETLLDKKFKNFSLPRKKKKVKSGVLKKQKKVIKTTSSHTKSSLLLKNKKKLKLNKKNKITLVASFWQSNRTILSKYVTRAWRSFFLGGTLSQYLDETNPLAEITHKRRITLLGPGGVNSKQTTIKIRGIHPTYYGRLCPIETPEGQNAGLVHSLTVFGHKASNGTILTPYYKVYKGQTQNKLNVIFLNPEKESSHVLVPSDVLISKWGRLPKMSLPARKNWDFDYAKLDQITTQSISILQMISLATSLIPFLEHDDANRALMGSNMQRQAVPLLKPEVALVKTSLEPRVVSDINHIIQTRESGFITQVVSNSIQLYKPKTLKYFFIDIGEFTRNLKKVNIKYNTIFIANNLLFPNALNFYYLHFPLNKNLLKFQKRNKNNFLSNFINSNQFTSYSKTIKKNKISLNNLKNNLNTKDFFLSAGNFLLIKEKVNQNKPKPLFLNNKRKKIDYKLFHLNLYKRGNQSTCTLQRPIVAETDWVEKSTVLADGGASDKGKLAIGKNVFIAYLPWEGYNFEDAVLISENLVSQDIFTSLHLDYYQVEVQKTAAGLETITNDIPLNSSKEISQILNLDARGIIKKGTWVKEGDYLVGKTSNVQLKGISAQYEKLYNAIIQREKLPVRNTSFRVPKGVEGLIVDVEILPPKQDDILFLAPKNSILCVKLSLLQRRRIQVGDKIAGRHGNKGVISKILPVQDMPYLPDGTPIDVVLNPLGIPSRMNVGQILECLLGLAGKYLNESFTVNLFDEKFGTEASRSFVYSKLYQASLKSKNSWLFEPEHPGKIKLFDGRTGIIFQQPVTVGYTYMLKLVHMVDDKIHARATGPYSALTQQPVRGRARNGGQRLGEMEVWALQAYGAAYTLQELITIKSDDIDGRNEAVLRIFYNKPIEMKQPESIKLLLREIQVLCISLEIFAPSYNTKKTCLVDLNDLDGKLV